MLALYLMLLVTYYVLNYATIIAEAYTAPATQCCKQQRVQITVTTSDRSVAIVFQLKLYSTDYTAYNNKRSASAINSEDKNRDNLNNEDMTNRPLINTYVVVGKGNRTQRRTKVAP